MPDGCSTPRPLTLHTARPRAPRDAASQSPRRRSGHVRIWTSSPEGLTEAWRVVGLHKESHRSGQEGWQDSVRATLTVRRPLTSIVFSGDPDTAHAARLP